MALHYPAVTIARFEAMTPMPPEDNRFRKEYRAAKRSWMANPKRNLVLGKHLKTAKEQRVLDAFLGPYKILLRYYSCLYEDFMGTDYQLQYDWSQNSKVAIENEYGDDDEVTQMVRDPFPSKAFSDGLGCLLAQPIWRGRLKTLAFCLQFVNILRTNDTRPWKWSDSLPEPDIRFFRVWPRVVERNQSEERPMQELFKQVKEDVDDSLYTELFDSIVAVVCEGRRPAADLKSQRTSDDDPYFIHAVDLVILKQAIDRTKNVWGLPMFQGPNCAEAMLKHSRPDQDYPRRREFANARDREMVYATMMCLNLAKDIKPEPSDSHEDPNQDDSSKWNGNPDEDDNANVDDGNEDSSWLRDYEVSDSVTRKLAEHELSKRGENDPYHIA
ncbi:hypothetical protein GGR53DRAFT_516532 [Hypoxylon sp. FL1150]|nr:hypothetical protein GGR53DRAFT_516532 [Hypoxylon sp. FL1150]